MLGTESTQDLAQAATAGDGAAQRALVARLRPIIRARVNRVLCYGSRAAPPREQDVQDAAQEVWLALFADRGKALRAWRPDAGMSFDNYVGMIAERRSVSIERRRRKRLDAERLDESAEARAPGYDEPERQAGARELLSQVMLHVERTFPGELWRSITDELVEARAEPGAESRCKAYAARYRLRRAARMLRMKLETDFQVVGPVWRNRD